MADGRVEELVLAWPYPSMYLRDYGGGTNILVEGQMLIQSDKTLGMAFEDALWGSTISFDSGVAASLDGTLELDFADGVDVAGLAGTTYQLFDWTNATVSGVFANIETHGLRWGTGRLYSHGVVAFIEGIDADWNADGSVNGGDIDLLAANYGNVAYDLNGDGVSDRDDLEFMVWFLVDMQDGTGRAGTEFGDVNLDGLVNTTDLAALADNFGTTGRGWAGGDLNGDGIISTTDLTIMAANFGFSAASDNIPEPATLSLLMIGAAAFLGRKRRGR